MFCYQCEQTAKGTGCTVQGVCGKQPEVAALQDLLLYSLMGLSQVAVEGRKHGVTDGDVNVFTVQAAFSTLTNFEERCLFFGHVLDDLRISDGFTIADNNECFRIDADAIKFGDFQAHLFMPA